jgi:hypothetical protein
MVDSTGCDQLLSRRVIQRQRREQAFRQPDLVHRRLKALADKQRLSGMLENNRIA